MQATIESLEELGISLDHEIKCDFSYGPLPGTSCPGAAVARITFKCKCGYSGRAFICAECLYLMRSNPGKCRCARCGKVLKPHWWSINRCKWKEI